MYKDLMKVFEKSKRVSINSKSKIVIISDIHRGDGSYSDSLVSNKNIYKAALNYYFKEGYVLIEAGDGDELWKNKNCMDIAYNYKDVFRILNRFNKANRLYLLYGNHDNVKVNKEYFKKQKKKFSKIDIGFGSDFLYLIDNIEFSEGLVLKYEEVNKEIFITHGHQVDLFNYELKFLSKFLVRHIWRHLEGIAGFKAPISPANNYKRGGIIDNELDEWARENKKMIICGHTHLSRFPQVSEGTYFNDGCCVLPYSISCIEISRGLIILVKWTIESREDRSLYIMKQIIGGPEKLENYLKYVD
ncbi:MAG: metallophosphoesterase [Clostridiaceae bacterium]|nr:metallophosphoesterase [Clostridiaceae bacterium]